MRGLHGSDFLLRTGFMQPAAGVLFAALLFGRLAPCSQAAPPATSPTTAPGVVDKLPHIQVDLKNKQVRVECQALKPDYGLEFFVCATDTNEYEAVLRTSAKPSQIHLAMLMIGLKPGEPMKYIEAEQKYIPPHGPTLKLSCEFEKNGKKVTVPANKMLRSTTDHKDAPPLDWIFAGSHVMPDGSYAADGTGSIVAILNSDLSVITLPALASRALENREWEYNPDVCPAPGSTVWLIIEPAGDLVEKPATAPATHTSATQP